ncbi:FkbM family methyltransferase [Clostridium sp. BJN0001]|uniref:FkbM family methyltransferase n=1 Tax=Clostridium sp. BJN0001 TaxID=2930219 RepID=UPI001FD1CF68|nr:FkbM family methyltransferase [Clostridium sp. BJN0001]
MKKKVVLFGASELGKKAVNLLKEKYEIVYFCDNDIAKQGKKINNVLIISFNRLKEIYQDYEIIITSMYIKEISKQLKELKLRKISYFLLVNDDTYKIRTREKEEEKDVYSITYNNRKIKFYLPNRDEYIQGLIYDYSMFYEIKILEKIKEFDLKDKVIIDVGANIGNHSLYFAKVIDSLNVYSFEPNIKLRKIFEKNMKINNIDNKVFLKNCALSNEECYGNLEIIDKNNWGSNKIKYDKNGFIQVKTLDDIMLPLNKKIGLIKVDVEGMEYLVLKGAEKIIAKYRPILCVEILTEIKYKEITEYLKKYGYKKVFSFNCATYIFRKI